MEPIKQNVYNYIDIIFNKLQSQITSCSIICLSQDMLFLNMQLLLDIIKKYRVTIRCYDYASLIYLDKLLNRPIYNHVILIDDGKMISREYIDITKLKNIRPIVPLVYLGWGLKFNDFIATYCFKEYLNFSHRFVYVSFNGNDILSLTNMKKIYEKIEKLNFMQPKNDAEKIYLVSDYLQSQVSYYDSPATERISGLVETILNYKAGICVGIANLTTLLLNNAIMQVEVEGVCGNFHAWNKVGIGNSSYYVDNTWSITRGANSVNKCFTKKFNDEFLLTGSTNPEQIPETTFIYQERKLAQEDYSKLNYEKQFTYQDVPRILSLSKK